MRKAVVSADTTNENSELTKRKNNDNNNKTVFISEFPKEDNFTAKTLIYALQFKIKSLRKKKKLKLDVLWMMPLERRQVLAF